MHQPPAQHRYVARLAATAAMLAVVVYLGLAFGYLLSPNYYDHIEPSIAAITEQALQGYQIYLAPDSSHVYSLLYGPAVYIANALFMALSPNPILGSKLCGVLLGIGGIAAAWAAMSRRFRAPIANILLCAIVVCACWFTNNTFWNRADSLLLWCIGLALLGLAWLEHGRGFLLVILALGIATNAKAHAPLYFLPLFVLIDIGVWKRRFAAATALLVLVLLAPFAYARVFSLGGYIYWLAAAGRHPLSLDLFVTNLATMALMSLPLGILLSLYAIYGRSGAISSKYALAGGLCLATMLAVCVIAAKRGAGSYHLIPFIPVVAYLTGAIWLELRPQIEQAEFGSPARGRLLLAIAALWVCFALARAAIGAAPLQPLLLDTQGDQVQADLLQISRKYAGYSQQIGYGGDLGYRATFFRPLVYNRREYFVDAPSLMDLRESRIDYTVMLQKLFTAQSVDCWLIPRDDAPFSMDTRYEANVPLFSDATRQAFQANYMKVDSSRFYDVWQARRLLAP
jgi:hypothetical protein